MQRLFVSKTLLRSLLCLVVVVVPNNDIVHYVEGAPITIDSGTLETAIGSPTLGAGYTITNNAFYSSCLDFNDANIVSPKSFNHECEFIPTSHLFSILNESF